MRLTTCALLALALLTATPTPARAQSSFSDVAVRGISGDPGAPLQDVPVAAPTPSVPSGCMPGVVSGVHPSDAQTAVWLVCEDFRRRGGGRPAVLAPSDAPPVYRVGVMSLGRAVVLTVQVESPVGTVRDSRQLRLSGIEEVAVAGPRLVDSLIFGTPVVATQRTDNLVGEETREYKKKQGEFLYGGGLMGVLVAGSKLGLEPGLDFRAGYESSRFGIGADVRVGTGSDSYGREGADYGALGVGGRCFLSDTDASFFVGGGLTWSAIDVRSEELEEGRNLEGSGLGAYGEAGLALLRTHSSRLTFDLRFETPFYELEGEEAAWSSEYDAPDTSQPAAEAHYVVPVMGGLSYTF